MENDENEVKENAGEDTETIETENIRHINDIRPKKIRTISQVKKDKKESENEQEGIEVTVRNIRAYMLDNVFCAEEAKKDSKDSKGTKELKEPTLTKEDVMYNYCIEKQLEKNEEYEELEMGKIDEVDYQLWQHDFCNVMDVLFSIDEIKKAHFRIKAKNFVNGLYDKWIKVLYRLRLKKTTWGRLEDALKYENNKILSTEKEYNLILKKMAIALSIFNDSNVEKIQNVIKNRTCEGILAQRPHLDIDLF
jgi:hypothetical protein